jgi:hypothetical protein
MKDMLLELLKLSAQSSESEDQDDQEEEGKLPTEASEVPLSKPGAIILLASLLLKALSENKPIEDSHAEKHFTDFPEALATGLIPVHDELWKAISEDGSYDARTDIAVTDSLLALGEFMSSQTSSLSASKSAIGVSTAENEEYDSYLKVSFPPFYPY